MFRIIFPTESHETSGAFSGVPELGPIRSLQSQVDLVGPITFQSWPSESAVQQTPPDLMARTFLFVFGERPDTALSGPPQLLHN